MRKSFVAIYNLKKEKHILVNASRLCDDENELPIEVNLQSTYFGKDRLIAVSDPIALLSHDYENSQSIGYNLKQKVKETDNPIIVIYKEK